jgi:hypothetical protein
VELSDKDIEALKETEGVLSRLSAGLSKQVIGPALSLTSKIPFKTVHYKGVLNRRTVELAESCLLLLHTDNGVAAAVIGKALYETVAMEYLLSTKMDEVVKQSYDVARFDGWLTRCLYGQQDPAMEEMDLVPYSVGAAIENVDKLFSGVAKFYKGLSDFAGPDNIRVIQSYSRLDPPSNSVSFHNSTEEGTAGREALNGFVTALAISDYAGRRFERLMPGFTKVCEASPG